jgi:hypothetical protein
MLNAKWLVKNPQGFYSLHPAYDVRRARVLEDQIIDVIREAGGICSTVAILEAFGVEQSKAKVTTTSSSDYRRIHAELKKSSKIRRYYRPGFWGLRWKEMLGEPLPGRYADFLIREGYFETYPEHMKKRDTESRVYELIRDHFDRVGTAFQSIRLDHDCKVGDLLKDDGVRDALQIIRDCEPRLVNQVYADIRKEAERRAREIGKPDDGVVIEKVRDEETPRLLEHLYLLFEAGTTLAHMAAPAQFYRAVASFYQICPASLSRGFVMPIPAEIEAEETVAEDDEEIEVEEPSEPEPTEEPQKPFRSRRI